MNPKKKILILSGCLLTVAAVVGGTFFVQKSSNHVLNKTSIGKFHEAEEHTATGVVVCKTEALQEVFQQKKEEVLLAKQEVPDFVRKILRILLLASVFNDCPAFTTKQSASPL